MVYGVWFIRVCWKFAGSCPALFDVVYRENQSFEDTRRTIADFKLLFFRTLKDRMSALHSLTLCSVFYLINSCNFRVWLYGPQMYTPSILGQFCFYLFIYINKIALLNKKRESERGSIKDTVGKNTVKPLPLPQEKKLINCSKLDKEIKSVICFQLIYNCCRGRRVYCLSLNFKCLHTERRGLGIWDVVKFSSLNQKACQFNNVIWQESYIEEGSQRSLKRILI